ncbi:hypothetical protein PEC302107_24540 [Pectobacterium araliae]|uniref:conjugal transfer protein TraD n=1 Tax=Pectobacterium araliae TaxID=3073862 RepID=UPI00207D8777|nr:hypothetical protein PEC302107_24540 [Pectobacterium carotovorum subsp. carotovorum]
MEKKNLRQLIASAQQELNRLTTAEKALTRKEKTHKKIVLGGEVAKYMGLDIDHDLLVGFLLSFASSTKEDLECYISNGVRARENENLLKEQKNKNSMKKHSSKKQDLEIQDKMDKDPLSDIKKKDNNPGDIRLQYSHFSRMLEKGLVKKKDNND